MLRPRPLSAAVHLGCANSHLFSRAHDYVAAHPDPGRGRKNGGLSRGPGRFSRWLLSTMMLPPNSRAIVARYNGTGAGPATLVPSSKNTLPWQGHFKRSSLANQLGVHPRWVQMAINEYMPSLLRIIHTRWASFKRVLTSPT